ncbi:molybdopterin guanine dinucleotide-containing S/N-oxide reductase [Arcobacter sp. LA11]|uniref:molybdopterin guanine dinucleotide-containing S/N-oxide reductase n=1 Tax=Arcobacter sp. LA11 TaxID=1898176 RepID=UPI000932ED8D|nr:molybdopterin guanine dinucleotide-containing S/N-oxide reductase [Arcobacter sp. LA11]
MRTLNRRTFLQGTAALALMPAVSACAKNVEAMNKIGAMGGKGKFVQNGSVNTAAHWGGLKVTVEDGKVVNSTNVLKNFQYNSLQSTVEDLVYAEDRIKYPMVRKSYLKDPDNSKPELRGSEEWVRVSWEEGLKLAADQMKKTRETKGSSGIFSGCYGWKSSGNFHNARTLAYRFMRTTGGFVGHKGDYSTGASQVIMPHVMGSIEVYEQQTSWEVVLESTDVVVVWGANPMATLKIAWSSSDSEGLEYFKKLRDSGKKIICIDPVYSETCQFLNPTKWVTPKPNTDVAMMIGMCHTLYTKKKHNQDFLDEYTEGFDKFRDYFMGKADGVVRDSKWAAKISGVDAKTIDELALLFAANRTMLMSGWALQRQHLGEQRHWALVSLASMIGQIGLPGGGFGLSYHYANGGAPTATGGKIGGISSKSNWGMKTKTAGGLGHSYNAKDTNIAIPVARISDMLLNPGKTIDYNGTRITYPEIETIYWAGGNPFHHQQDTNKLIKGWKTVKNVFVNEIYWTATARMADIVFPVTTTFERNDITMAGDYSNKYIYPMKQVIPTQHEAQSDYWIFTELAKHFGKEKEFTEEKTEMEWVSEFYEIARSGAAKKGVKMPMFRKFWADNKPFEFKVSEASKKWVRHADYREDPLLNPLGTPSGRIELYSQKIADMKYDDCKGHVTWMEPIERYGMKNQPAPLALVSPHPSERLHSQQNNTSLRHNYEVQGREPIWISIEDAKARGINDGDLVRVFNKRGQTLAGAVVTKNISKGVVRMQEGGWYDPLEPGKEGTLCKHGNVNTLTVDIPTSKLASGNSAHTALVDVEKYKGKVPNISLFKQPKMA